MVELIPLIHTCTMLLYTLRYVKGTDICASVTLSYTIKNNDDLKQRSYYSTTLGIMNI